MAAADRGRGCKVTDEHWSAKLETAVAILQRIERAVYGNGQKGILDRVAVLEQLVLSLAEAQRSCPAREAARGGARRQRHGNVIALVAVTIALASLAVTVWA